MRLVSAAMLLIGAILTACTSEGSRPAILGRYPPVTLPAVELPTYAVGDSFTFDNPEETWTVIAIEDGLISWRSTRGGTKTTAFDPLLPALKWSGNGDGSGMVRLVQWDRSLFPLQSGNKNSVHVARFLAGEPSPTKLVWRCFTGNARKVTVKAGSFPAYPVFCRRNDDLTVQYFYAPDARAPVLVRTRRRPAPERSRELIRFKHADATRVAAAYRPGLPLGWAQLPVPLAANAPPRQEARAPDAVAIHPEATPTRSSHAGGDAGPAASLFRVQLASYRLAENVESGWRKLSARLRPLLDDLDHDVQVADLGSGKGIFYRLIAGRFSSQDDAERLCKSIRDRGAACLVKEVPN